MASTAPLPVALARGLKERVLGNAELGGEQLGNVVDVLGAVDLALVQSGAKAHEDVVVLLGVLGQDDVGAGERDLVGVVGVGAEDEVVVAELLLEGDGVGRPGGGGVDLAGDEGRRHAGDVHLDGVDVVDGEAGVLEDVLEDDLGGGAGGDAHRLAGEVSAGLDAVGPCWRRRSRPGRAGRRRRPWPGPGCTGSAHRGRSGRCPRSRTAWP